MAPKKVQTKIVEEVEKKPEVHESDSESVGSTSNPEKKTQRKVPLEKVLAMLKKGEVDKATAALETIVGDKKDKKQREPSAFNKFVKEKMADLKGSSMSTKEKMAECARLWKEQKTS